jgi:hypothetical protein
VSYDLHLLRRETVGDDPSAAYERLEELDERAPTPEEEQRLRELAAELQDVNPGLDLVEASTDFCLQLGYEAERPVVIDIAGVDDITMMWSYGADDVEPALAEVGLYLPVFERYGYVAFDPQLERLFDFARDSRDAAAVHTEVRGQVFAELDHHEPSSWLRRLLGR